MSHQILDTNFKYKDIPWNDYPRPNLVRNSYLNLNGLYDYMVTREHMTNKFLGKVMVPFPIESKLSLVEKTLKKGEYLFYHKDVTLDPQFIKDKLLLHFGAVDNISDIYINNIHAYHHEGGYLPFSFDIKKYLKDTHFSLLIRVKDDMDLNFPYGKQKIKRGGMWYTKISGIWQTVWLESVDEKYIKNIIITPDIDKSEVNLKIISDATSFIIKYENKVIKTREKEITLKIDNLHLWSPEDPYLYDLVISTDNDLVRSYFAMRKFSVKNGKMELNNKPYFFNGLLDQGYFSDGIFLPASSEGYLNDIKTMKSLGFNTLRKHIKIEPLTFYYLCDKLGMIVWQDMVNNSRYSFLFDTVFPTIGIKRKFDKYSHISKKSREIFISHTIETILHLYNFPSIALWTIFNEGWGQFNAKFLYKKVKELDNTRFIDTCSGWFETKYSDVISKHVYFKKLKFKGNYLKPLVLSEFGGYAYKIANHSFNLDKTFGYKKFKDQSSFQADLIRLYQEEVIPAIKNNNLNAAIYTQVSDVEDETNGLFTYDRMILKVDKDIIVDLMSKVKFDVKK